MTDAPERIWATGHSRSVSSRWWSKSPTGRVDEAPYIRADLSPSPEVVKELVKALELADAALSGANMDMKNVWRKIKSALANAKLEGGE